jgi:hypothetical protein
MASGLAGVTIYLEQDSGWRVAPRLSFLDPLDATETTIHVLGVPSNRRTITGTIRSSVGDYDTLVVAAEAHSAVNLTTDIDSATVIILDISAPRIQNVGTETWWRFTAELMETT